MPNTFYLRKPDDWHCHFRQGEFLKRTVNDTASQFARAIIMPNLQPPITTVDQALTYRQQILAVLNPTIDFTPLMTLYLTDQTTPALIEQAAKSPHIYACKLYPAGATTHSAAGVTDFSQLRPVFAAMQTMDLPLLIHGETTHSAVDIFDRERQFIEQYLVEILTDFPNLRIVLEHISTAFAAEFIRQAPAHVAATITAHHLWLNRNDLLVSGIKPHHYCLPIVKRAKDQQALIDAATSGNPKFFLGTDSAPHTQSTKESACGCAGIYTAWNALPLYAQIFDQAQALDRLENFASCFGAQFYQLPLNTTTIGLTRQSQTIPKQLTFGAQSVIPFMAGETLNWQVIPSMATS
ncbi:MAG: dihydroorotase [Legionellales bacterium]|nr:dihydroorotase [Legionellales bacterium]